ncbi:hypothetical protein WICANDRAFT_81339 [Wickerhamomyces anomalus NRRL Y-366-8]|uniref:Uncharacterized protein n=1 Tax=Wickerhamomyces anomalus (strain ATCC 58044 / CBS 1984 / NCYC 433 / NRRL Y-366-8) TaxID=683960 RepID=A0A1E3NVG4_WICAA|nr:uncharacterized protein WICANDRAFT_81339 [Wickerhamomyces anomalus NRRL Y-366-8]ODQ57116.1 hypothetical protein WICANDRAFT_81339 [Wickerhamomyces anomalus NRRL Y-366-8]
MPDHDCISITEKTFDLSLDDTQIDDDDLSGDEQPLNSQILLDNTYDSLRNGKVQNKFKTVITNKADDDRITINRAVNGTIQYNEKKEQGNDHYLCKSLQVLQRISGTDIKINEEETNQISKLIYELSENSELKIQFYEKNYKFLENLYETLQKSNERVKIENKELRTQNESLKLRLDEMKNTRDQDEVVLRQEKEIRGYKRFIKELMER